MAKLNLDLSGVVASTGKSVLPTGIYNTVITAAEPKQTKGNAAHYYLEVSFTVEGGEHDGKSVVNRFNIVNSNADAQKYALRDVKTILTAAGHANPNALSDSDEMIGLKVRVSLEEAIQMKDNQPVCNDDGKPYRENKFKGYFKPTAAEAVVEAPVSAPVESPVEAPAAATAPAAFPWNS